LKKYNIPTAAYEIFNDAKRAKDFIKSLGAPIVVKASGLAAGKGVVVAHSVEEAYKAVDDMLVNKIFGGAGEELKRPNFSRLITFQLAFKKSYFIHPIVVSSVFREVGKRLVRQLVETSKLLIVFSNMMSNQ
jgi:phosphoribosylamine--glycine ligase